MASGLGAPGGAVYAGTHMHVGDGTWNSKLDDFLLPNIQGLNFATMRYNGMGNRFHDLAQYHTLILGHGVVAAITFLGIVPAAIFIARFYYPDPRLALRIHISLQIITLILVTVVLVLGYFAVGPERSLTNPHHGIGVAIFVLILFQAIWGWFVHWIEKSKVRSYIPVKLMFHQWLGRATSLLTLAQIPIGLTLYGSPLFLFVLYAIYMFFLVILYFIFTHQSHKRAAYGLDEHDSYVTGTHTDFTGDGRQRHHFGRDIFAGTLLGGAGLAALRRRRSQRHDGAQVQEETVEQYSHAGGGSYTEKYHDRDHDHTWRNRILGGAAGVGGLAALTHWYNRRRGREDENNPSYRPPLGGYPTESAANLNMMEEGRPISDNYNARLAHGETLAQSHVGGYSNVSYDSEDSRRAGRWSLGRLAAIGGIGEWFHRRRERREQDRIDSIRRQDHEVDHRFSRTEVQPLVGPGVGRQFDGLPGPVPHPLPQNIPPPPRSNFAPPPPNANLGPPPAGLRTEQEDQYMTTAYGSPGLHQQRSASDQAGYTRFQTDRAAAGIAGPPPVPGLVPPPAVASPPRSGSAGSPGRYAGSPPVSVKVRMHSDGRHVTLRRLNEEEAALERARGRGQDVGVASDPLRIPGPAQSGASPGSSAHQPISELQLPGSEYTTHTLEQPVPSGVGSGTYGPGSGPSEPDYEAKRRRRRAERARNAPLRGAGGSSGKGVEFT